MPYRPYPPSSQLLFGYDPERDLPRDHLARLVDQVVEEAIQPPVRPAGKGQPPFDPRLPIKVLIYGYATGHRSSRQLERLCDESLPYLFLTRGDTPSYRTLCSVRVEESERLEEVFVSLFAVAEVAGMRRVGHIVVDSTKIRANASPEAVLASDEYGPVRNELQRILQEAQVVDEREDSEGRPGETRLGKSVPRDQMRDIVRRVRKQLAQKKRQQSAPQASAAVAPEPTLAGATTAEAADEPGQQPAMPNGETASSPLAAAAHEQPTVISTQMRERVEAAVEAIEAATEVGREHLCLTDPDARMMYGGRVRRTTECHSFEVAVDKGARLLVAGETSQAANDNARLEPMLRAAAAHEPAGVWALDADSGYYQGDTVGKLIAEGVDTCVPDSDTAGDLHRGQPIGTLRARKCGQVSFDYDPERDLFRCPSGNELRRVQKRQHGGRRVSVYRAVDTCVQCELAHTCLRQKTAQHRTLKVGVYEPELAAACQRFEQAAHQERYRRRADAVETVFGFLRGTLGYTRWQLRGKERVECEGRLFKTAYQFRKVHAHWAPE